MDNHTFIDRSDELDIISHLMSRLKTDASITHPIREYVGLGGVGKTALLQEIRKLAVKQGVLVSYLDYPSLSSVSAEGKISEIIHRVGSDLKVVPNNSATGLPTPVIDSSSGDINGEYIKRIQELFCVVILDSLNLAPLEVLQGLAEKFLFPLAETGRTLIVLGSRKRLQWGNPNFRLMRRTRSTALLTFPASYTAQQLDPFSNIVQEIQRVTCGHPEANDIVSRILDYAQNLNILDEHSFGDYESRLVSGIVEQVIQKRAIIPVELFKAFSYLSVFRIIDVDLPTDVLSLVDENKKWSDPMEVIQLIREMQDKTDYVVSPNAIDAGYRINEFVRMTLSLHLRFFRPEEFLNISRIAVSYFERKFYKDVSQVHFLIEKIYHYADILRVSYPYLSDLDIASRIRTELRRNLEAAYASPLYLAVANKPILSSPVHNIVERQAAFDKLLSILKQDVELSEKIGDISGAKDSAGNFLLQIVEECWKEFTSSGVGILEILKHYQPKDETGNTLAASYEVSFRRSAKDVIRVTRSFQISPQASQGIRNDSSSAKSLSDVTQLGSGLMGQLPSDIQRLLLEHTEPLVLDVNDTSIPWELLHDGRQFLSVRLPLGKQIRTSEIPRISRTSAGKPRVLIVGVPSASFDPSYTALRFVEEEINQLLITFRGLPDVVFDPANDVLFSEEAHVWEVQKRLKSGQYRIIHFAGHSVYDETTQQGGIVLHDGILKTETIRNSVEGQPLIFLNACQSAQGNTGLSMYGDYRGIHASGIASSFIIGGALSCIASIWEVKDQYSSRFSIAFYSNLMNGLSVGEALRRTKQSEFNRNPEDRTWASYILYGDPIQKIQSL